MDANTTWLLLLEAIRNEQWINVRNHAEVLLEWLDRGGFSPDTSNGMIMDQY